MRRAIRSYGESDEFNIWPSFADVVTGIFLFLIFVFILLIIQQFFYSIRLSELERFLGTIEKEMKSLEKEFVKEEGGGISVDVKQGRIVLEQKVLFEFDSADVKPDKQEMLWRLGESLRGVLDRLPGLLAVSIDGHTDNVGGYMYNLRLGSRRAIAVLNVLTGLLFQASSEFKEELNKRYVPRGLVQEFRNNGILLSRGSYVSVEKRDRRWLITDSDNDRRYLIERELERENDKQKHKLYVYLRDHPRVISPEEYDISANTYGEYEPINRYSVEKADEQNRRIEIRIIPKFDQLLQKLEEK